MFFRYVRVEEPFLLKTRGLYKLSVTEIFCNNCALSIFLSSYYTVESMVRVIVLFVFVAVALASEGKISLAMMFNGVITTLNFPGRMQELYR